MSSAALTSGCVAADDSRVVALLRVLALPLLVLGPTAVAIALIESGWVASVPLSPPLAALVLFLVTVLPAVAFIVFLERVIPHRAEWSRSHGDERTDTLHLFSSYAVQHFGRLALVAMGAGVAGWLSRSLGGSLWPSAWPMALQVALALVFAELGHYLFHRLSHEWPPLWRLHATHHSAERLYWLNTTRFHVLDILLLQAFSLAPLIVLGVPEPTLLAYSVYVLVFGYVQHSNVDYRAGWLDFVLSTPALHRFHHSADPREGNTNYAGDLMLWDQLFGTFHRPRGAPFAGAIGNGLDGFPRGFVAQQLSPFRSQPGSGS